MATKKLTVDDFTQAPQAMTAEDVNNQDARTRLWQSLDYTYGNQIRKSNEAYDQAYSQNNNAMLKRGMQRSSYGLQTGANILNKKIEAQNEIGAAQIADYQNRIGQIEQQEKEDERWERQFAANREDSAWNKEFQTNQFEYGKSRDLVADAQWQKEYNERLRQFNENMAFQKERANVSDTQWQKEYDEKLRQFNEQMALEKDQWNFQKAQASAAAAASGGGGGGSYSSGRTNNDSDAGATTTNATDALLNGLFGGAKSSQDVFKKKLSEGVNYSNRLAASKS